MRYLLGITVGPCHSLIWRMIIQTQLPELTIFDEDNIEKYEKYMCAICGKILKEAIQLPQLDVPTRACHSCYTANIRYVKTFAGVMLWLVILF